MDADPKSHLQPVGPFAGGEVALDGHRRLDGGAGALEDREELVGARVDLAAARARDGGPKDSRARR